MPLEVVNSHRGDMQREGKRRGHRRTDEKRPRQARAFGIRDPIKAAKIAAATQQQFTRERQHPSNVIA